MIVAVLMAAQEMLLQRCSATNFLQCWTREPSCVVGPSRRSRHQNRNGGLCKPARTRRIATVRPDRIVAQLHLIQGGQAAHLPGCRAAAWERAFFRRRSFIVGRHAAERANGGRAFGPAHASRLRCDKPQNGMRMSEGCSVNGYCAGCLEIGGAAAALAPGFAGGLVVARAPATALFIR